jgi:hypothetical protein
MTATALNFANDLFVDSLVNSFWRKADSGDEIRRVNKGKIHPDARMNFDDLMRSVSPSGVFQPRRGTNQEFQASVYLSFWTV